MISWLNYKGNTYGDYAFPSWANVLGWCITFSSVICVPIVAMYKISQEQGSLVSRLRKLTQPSEEWGSRSFQHRLPELRGAEGGDFRPGGMAGCAQGSTITLLTNASNPNILKGEIEWLNPP